MRRKRAATMPSAAGPRGLAAAWRADAAVLRHRGAEALAASLESCADELERWAEEWALERLTLEQAARESGYGYSTLQHLVAGKRIPNAGSPRRPRIRRADLPRKVSAPPGGVGLADRVLRAASDSARSPITRPRGRQRVAGPPGRVS